MPVQIPPLDVPVHHTALPVFVKERARRITERALAVGELRGRPAACEECGKVGPVEVHHRDYRAPLEIAYLCVWCHGRADNANREAAGHLNDNISIKVTRAEKASLVGLFRTKKIQPRALLLAFINSADVRDAVHRYFLQQAVA